MTVDRLVTQRRLGGSTSTPLRHAVFKLSEQCLAACRLQAAAGQLPLDDISSSVFCTYPGIAALIARGMLDHFEFSSQRRVVEGTLFAAHLHDIRQRILDDGNEDVSRWPRRPKFKFAVV